MSDPLEAAGQAFREPQDPRSGYAEAMRAPIVAFVCAAVGCEQCCGTGKVQDLASPAIWWKCGECDCGYPEDHKACCDSLAHPHAEIVVLGETIYADPEKTQGWCISHDHEPRDGKCRRAGYDHGRGYDCIVVSQPRWSLLAGGV